MSHEAKCGRGAAPTCSMMWEPRTVQNRTVAICDAANAAGGRLSLVKLVLGWMFPRRFLQIRVFLGTVYTEQPRQLLAYLLFDVNILCVCV